MESTNLDAQRLSRVYSASSLLLLQSLQSVDSPVPVSPRARLKADAERHFARDFETWTHRQPLPKLRHHPINISSSSLLNDARTAVARKEVTLQRLQDQLTALEFTAYQLNTSAANRSAETRLQSSIADLTANTERAEAESESFEVLIARLREDLVLHKKKAAVMVDTLQRLKKEVEMEKEREINDEVELRDLREKVNIGEKRLAKAREARLSLLGERLDEAEEAHEGMTSLREAHIEKEVQLLSSRQRIDSLKDRIMYLSAVQSKTSVLKASHDSTKRMYLSIKLTFERFFGSSDPDAVIGVYTRAIYRSEMLRREVEELLSGQDKASRELEVLKRMKEEARKETESVTNRDVMRAEERHPTHSSVGSDLAHERTTLIHLCFIALASIYSKTAELDPFLELSVRLETSSSIAQLLLIVEKRVLTALGITTQALCIPHRVRAKVAKKRQTIRPEKREEMRLKANVFRDHFVSNADGHRRASLTIESMLAGMASLLTHQNASRLSIKSTIGALADPKKRKAWKSDGYTDEFTEKQESNYWASERKSAKGDSLTVRLTSSDSLPLSSPRSLPIKKRQKQEKTDYGSVLRELKDAQKKMEKLKRQNLGRCDPSAPLSPRSSQGSAKTKDTSLGVPTLRVLPQFSAI